MKDDLCIQDVILISNNTGCTKIDQVVNDDCLTINCYSEIASSDIWKGYFNCAKSTCNCN